MIPASLPIHHPRDARLLVVDEHGRVSHRLRSSLSELVNPDDLIVANDAATLPASLTGVHLPSGEAVEVRLAGRDSLVPDRVSRFVAVVFGAGDYRTPTENRPLPPPLHSGDGLVLGPLRAVIVRVIAYGRLVEVIFAHTAAEIWEGVARHGRPIQYSYVEAPLAIWDTWTAVASVPVAFEAPSAGFVLDWRFIATMRARGASFATLTHAAGISSTGDEALDRLLPLDEPYFIPQSTVDAITSARERGGRIIAVGTTVVRALEHAALRDGIVRAGEGLATGRVGSDTRLRIVDAIVSGMHEPGTSHYELLRAFVDDDVLRTMSRDADAYEYRTHEFGDSSLLIKSPFMNHEGHEELEGHEFQKGLVS
jgi:S-adenosylmethionine:tRNA ribosyltransferase-isomerase